MGARDEVNIKVSADVAQAIRAWRAMEQGPEAMANELEALGRKGKAAASGMQGEFQKLVGQWATIAAAIATAKQILDAFMSSQQQALKKTTSATTSADAMTRELFLLTPGDKSLDTIRNDMLRLAKQRRVQPGQAKEAMAALLGAGYSYDDTTKAGGAADAALRTLAATNATGKNVDTKSLVDALTGHLSATGQEKTAANLEKAGIAAQAMFAATKLEITDLLALGPRAKNISSITKLGNEQIPILSQFKDVTTADVGATAFHTASLRLKMAKDNPRSARALKELGLKPEDVDFAGESFFDVQNRLAGAFDKAGPDAQRIMGRMFGNEGILAGNVLFTKSGAAETRRRIGMAGDRDAFNFAASVNEGGYAAKQNLADVEQMQAFFESGATEPELARQALSNKLKEMKLGRFKTVAAERAFDSLLYVTGDPETAITGATNMLGTLSGLNGEDATAYSEKLRSSISQSAKAETIVIKLTDQDGVAIPHESPASKNNKAK